MDEKHYKKAKLRLALIFFAIIFAIIQIYSIYFVTIRYQGIRSFEEVAVPTGMKNMPGYTSPDQIAKKIKEQRDNTIYDAIIGQLLLSVLGAFASYSLAEFAFRPIKQNIEDQKNFLSFASHELKTPLSTLMLLTEDYTDSKGKSIQEEIEKLSNSTKKYLELLSHQSGNVKIESVMISQLVNDLLSGFNYTINYKGLKILNSIPNDLSVLTDLHGISTVLRNLLENAIKYSSNNSEIKIYSTPFNGKVKLIIENNFTEIQKGYGIGTHIIKFYSDLLKLNHKFEIVGNLAAASLEVKSN